MWNLFSKTIHYTAEEVHAEIIASTLMVLERIKVNVEKATLPAETNSEKAILQKLGLVNSKNMQVIKEAEAKINVHNSIIEDNIKVTKIMDEMYKAFGKNTFYIPMKDFVNVLNKYNLAVGRLEDYKGTIPENNLAEIVKAKEVLTDLRNNKKIIYYDKPITVETYECQDFYDKNLGKIRTKYVPVKKPDYEHTYMKELYPTLSRNIHNWYRLLRVDPKADKPSYKRFPMIKCDEFDWRLYDNDNTPHNMLIAAPVQEMNTLYEIKERVITDDPIVFSTVNNGVIIYSMWGDEGNDEVLKKYQDLNKFIAENVNLGAVTESKETLS